MPIDTLKSKRRLVEEYGLDDRQAEGIVELIAQSEERGATASDVDAAKREILMQLESQISATRSDLEAQIGSVKSDLEAQIGSVKSDLDARVGSVKSDLEAQITSTEERLRLEIEKMRRQMLQWMLGIAAFITVLLTLFEYVL
jgi:Fe2+ transport system protein B